MALAKRALRWLILHTLGLDGIARALVRSAHLMNLDLLVLAYRDAGILNYEDQTISGESFARNSVLPRLIGDTAPVIFDVGANVGEISHELRRIFPDARMWAFEPNPVTFSELSMRLGGMNISCQNLGLGAEPGTGELHCYLENQKSGHASMYRDVFALYGKNYGIKESANLTTFRFDVQTLDNFCRRMGIPRIDFLKIDVEGHELSVLRGASEMISEGKIAAIQFEITDCNVMSRVFMRDFYEQLEQYDFFRLKASGLLPLKGYQVRHEIFQFQNILAIRKELSNRIEDLTTK